MEYWLADSSAIKSTKIKENRMKLITFCAAAFLASSAVAADPPADPCKSGLPWVLPKVEPGFDVSEQYLLSGATTPEKIKFCHCTPKAPGKPTPHVWVNVLKKVTAQSQQGGGKLAVTVDGPSLQDLDKAWKDAKGKTQFEFISPSGNTLVASRLSAPACMTAVGLSVLVMHSSKDEDRWGTTLDN